jgi:DNA-binding NtrC family response regulator
MASPPQPFVLIADDDPFVFDALAHHLRGWGCRVAGAADKVTLVRLLAEECPDLLLLDLRFGEHDGVELLQELRRSHPGLFVVLITAHGSIDTAVSAIKLGACDYLTKPPDLNRLHALVRQAATRPSPTRGKPTDPPQPVWGDSTATRDLREQIAGVAPTDAPVLITGESGGGKEVVARELHKQSNRSSGPFIHVHLAALPANQAESTLFGKEGGPSGAFEAADGGTLFLDEISEAGPDVQGRLFRFLEERAVPRGGSSRPVDMRLVTATNRDLTALVRAGTFREDLYYRLNVVPLTVPPLRDRRDDVPVLADYFLRRSASRYRKSARHFSPEALERLRTHCWPGNIRQLENLVERLVIFSRTPEIGLDQLPPEFNGGRGGVDLPTELPSAGSGEKDAEGQELRPIDKMERQAIVAALGRSGGNVREAARLLGLGQATVYRKIKRYGLPLPTRQHPPAGTLG